MTIRFILYAAMLALCSAVVSTAGSSQAGAATVSTNILALRAQAENGEAKAQCLLGMCYLWGTRVSADKSEAAKWFGKAAEQDFPAAQYYLGNCYYNGEGALKDTPEAAKWYRKSAEHGFSAAQFNLALCYVKGEGVRADKAEAATWFRKAADQNNPAAQYNLGVFYYLGDGVKKDFIEAYKWLLLARAAKIEDAAPLCNTLSSKMATAEIAAAELRVKQWQEAFKQAHSAKD